MYYHGSSCIVPEDHAAQAGSERFYAWNFFLCLSWQLSFLMFTQHHEMVWQSVWNGKQKGSTKRADWIDDSPNTIRQASKLELKKVVRAYHEDEFCEISLCTTLGFRMLHRILWIQRIIYSVRVCTKSNEQKGISESEPHKSSYFQRSNHGGNPQSFVCSFVGSNWMTHSPLKDDVHKVIRVFLRLLRNRLPSDGWTRRLINTTDMEGDAAENPPPAAEGQTEEQRLE